MSLVVEIPCEKPVLRAMRAADTQLALEMVADPVLFFSGPSTPIVRANRAACHHLGYSRRELRRMSLADIAPDAVLGSLADGIARILRGKLQHARLETVYRRQNGTLLPVHCSIRALQKRPAGLMVAVAEILKEVNENSRPNFEAALCDPLTGLPNRAWILQQLELDAERARHGDYRFAVLFIDIDRFKAVNDSFGHLAGDQVLRAVAGRLTSSVRPGDGVARYGGDEFVVLLRDIDCGKSVGKIADRIRRRVTASGTRFGGEPWRAQVTLSVGAAISSERCSSALVSIDCADRAMYRAKALGRDGRFVMDELSKVCCD